MSRRSAGSSDRTRRDVTNRLTNGREKPDVPITEMISGSLAGSGFFYRHFYTKWLLPTGGLRVISLNSN